MGVKDTPLPEGLVSCMRTRPGVNKINSISSSIL